MGMVPDDELANNRVMVGVLRPRLANALRYIGY